MSERYDVVVFGATGFTGKYAIKSCFKLLKNHKWAIAGRNQQKLQDTLKEVGEKIGQNLSNIPIIIADVKDEKSLLDMAKQAKVVVNTCGPYRHFGEAVVKACIEASASHVDVSGEPQYMETMQLKYHEMAREKGIYIVSACGFDSIPADFGTVHMQREFGGTVNSVESFITFRYLDNYQPTGASVNYGTYESVIWGVAHNNELRGIRNQLYKNKLPKFTPTLKARSFIHKQPLAGNKYCIPFMGSDKSVVYRSQRHFFEHDNQRPVQMMPYIAIGNIFHISIAILMGIIFGFLTRFNFGINLLLNHPKFFTLGAATREGPAEEKSEKTLLEMYFVGEGWKEKLSNSTDQFDIPMNKKVTTRVSSVNPGYGATCDTLILSAKMILEESNKMPETGVLSPAAAFRKTSLLEQMQSNGITFEVLKVEEK